MQLAEEQMVLEDEVKQLLDIEKTNKQRIQQMENQRANKIKSIGDLAKREIEDHERTQKAAFEAECKKVSAC